MSKTPAEVVYKELGIRPLARMLNISPSAVAKWKDNGGKVPSKWHRRIIELSEGRVDPIDLVYGRESID